MTPMLTTRPNCYKHIHSGSTCPVTGQTHEWCPPQEGDSRSPCPALNTMANHGYIARDGKNLSIWDLVSGLRACYNLSTLLALFLSIVGFIILRRIRNVSLHEIGEHGRIEHDASLVHDDTPKGQKYAPIKIEERLVNRLVAGAKRGDEAEGPEYRDTHPLMDATDVAFARVCRERESLRRLDAMHAEIARGEMAIILGVWDTHSGKNVGVPVKWMREWLGHERLPKEWKPTHVQGLFDVITRAKAIRNEMEHIRA